MLEFLAYKKFKKNKAEKEEKARQEEAKESIKAESAASIPSSSSRVISKPKSPADESPKQQATPVLDDEDERFFQQLTASSADHYSDDDEGPKPPLPPRVKTPDLTWDSDAESFIGRREVDGKGKGSGKSTENAKEKDPKSLIVKQANRLSMFLRRDKEKEKKATKDGLKPHSDHLAVGEPEVDREKDDLTRILNDLNLAARNNKAFSLSTESTELVQKFTVVLKDLVNGVPTAVNDLTSLLEDKDGKVASNFEKLPKSMKKLVTQLPDKLSATLAPEVLAVAAEAQGLSSEQAAAQGGIKGAAKRLLMPKGLSDLVTKPGAIVGMLKGIMNALKLRWPAFIGTNVIWSVALFLLLFVLWYCHKRGREVRLENEAQNQPIDGSSRIEELPDDPALPAPSSPRGDEPPIIIETLSDAPVSGPKLPPPPMGADRHD